MRENYASAHLSACGYKLESQKQSLSSLHFPSNRLCARRFNPHSTQHEIAVEFLQELAKKKNFLLQLNLWLKLRTSIKINSYRWHLEISLGKMALETLSLRSKRFEMIYQITDRWPKSRKNLGKSNEDQKTITNTSTVAVGLLLT
jgi:hypothetical protein